MNSYEEQLETFCSEVMKLLESNGFPLNGLFTGEINIGIQLKWLDDNDLRIKEIYDLLKNNGYRNFIISLSWFYNPDVSKTTRKRIEIEFCPTHWLDLSLNHVPVPDFIS